MLKVEGSFQGSLRGSIVNLKKLETGLRTMSAGITYTLPFRIEAIGFPTFGLVLYEGRFRGVSRNDEPADL